ncbi:MAG: hypothetical protein N2482_00400 [Patescibacteria group bacterium]|nr:hypothetical protein [Patescibacteria group bacterium]
MKKIFLLIFFIFFFLIFPPRILALEPSYKIEITPIPCSAAPNLGDCPTDLQQIYKNEPCVSSYEEFVKNPLNNHFWVIDPEITNQGKADERARQFIYWAINKSSIDNHPVLKNIWLVSRNITFFLIILIVALFGLGFIIAQRNNFQLKINVWSKIWKVGLILLYASFSATIIIFLIQISEILMKFFIEQLSGKDLFNIYFDGISVEDNYKNFIGCRDLNLQVQEAIKAELFLLRLTNITYYVMGIMIILRKIILWFLLFVSPFLAILIPFIFIRNIGWIWIGVFFQWLFYGPLFALFLGGVAFIWQKGIPFPFDFSRTNNIFGYVYPTGINITYGGPAQFAAQKVNALNNGNYVDTFAEYIISLIMLWATIFFPWWLLRIFRDYCCDGIYAAKNILLSMYDQMRGSPTTQPPTSPLSPTVISTALKLPQQVEIPVKVRLETLEEIKKAQTEEITRSLDISVKKLTDIAHFETNKNIQESVRRNLNYLKNPIKAETPTERQKFMNIRTELFNRAVKEDKVAQTILSSISTSKIEQQQRREQIIKSVSKPINISQVVSSKISVPQQKISSLTSSFVNTTISTSGTNVINQVAQNTNLQSSQVQSILQSFNQNVNQPVTNITQKISEETKIEKEKVRTVLKVFTDTIKTEKKLTETLAQKEKLTPDLVEKTITSQLSLAAEPEKHIEETITVPPSVSIEEYEEVKKMWQRQYEKGEVPVSENISSREQWVNQDIVFITNTLNKLLSPDKELQHQGLDDLGYILPIFLVNNLSGEQLIVYLKAKLEAAKSVAESMTKEKEIAEKLKNKAEEELVELKTPAKKEEEKAMTMENELEIKEEKEQENKQTEKSV